MEETMKKDILLLDGANGTCLWAKTGDNGPVWRFNKLFPDAVKELASEYIDAGSDFVLSNTFSANRPSVAPFDFSVEEIVREGVILAKDAAGDRARCSWTSVLSPVFSFLSETSQRKKPANVSGK